MGEVYNVTALRFIRKRWHKKSEIGGEAGLAIHGISCCIMEDWSNWIEPIFESNVDLNGITEVWMTCDNVVKVLAMQCCTTDLNIASFI